MNQKSFTLIEILVVIVVIGILSSFILVGMTSIAQNANIAKSQAFLNSLDNSLLLSRVSEWKLDGNGNDSWNGKTVTLVSSPTIVSSCPQGSCYSFNGTSYAYVADDDTYFNFGTQMSAFVWIKGIPQNSRYIFNQHDLGLNKLSWVINSYGVSPYDQIRVWLSDNGEYSAGHRKAYLIVSPFFNNSWRLFGFTWDNGILRIYVDGVEKTGSELNKYYDDLFSTIYNSDANIAIATLYNNNVPQSHFVGQIDDARLYNKPIPISQIEQSYYIGLNKLYKNGGIAENEYIERIAELKINLTQE